MLNTGTMVSPESSRTKFLINVKMNILISRSATVGGEGDYYVVKKL